jgi:hypothetical protein
MFYAKVLELGAVAAAVTADDLVLYEQEQAKLRVAMLRKQLEQMQRDRNKTALGGRLAGSDGTSGWEPKAQLTRGVFVQLGQDRFVHFLAQLKWLLLSFAYVLKHEPPNLRTDIVVFTQIHEEEHKGALLQLEAFGCITAARTTFAEQSACRIRDYARWHLSSGSLLVRTNKQTDEIELA